MQRRREKFRDFSQNILIEKSSEVDYECVSKRFFKAPNLLFHLFFFSSPHCRTLFQYIWWDVHEFDKLLNRCLLLSRPLALLFFPLLSPFAHSVFFPFLFSRCFIFPLLRRRKSTCYFGVLISIYAVERKLSQKHFMRQSSLVMIIRVKSPFTNKSIRFLTIASDSTRHL